jgi:hypothetical protein
MDGLSSEWRECLHQLAAKERRSDCRLPCDRFALAIKRSAAKISRDPLLPEGRF